MNLRNTIKKVLIQESRALETINNYVEKHGLERTSEILGLSLTEIVKITNHPIDNKLANLIIFENFKNGVLDRTYKEFKLQPEYGDTIGWFGQIDNGPFKNYVEQYFIYATPYHDYLQEIPIDVSWCDLLNRDTGIVKSIEGDGIYWYKINVRDNFKSVEDLFEWYNNFYLPETYDVIMTKLIPEVRDDLEWRYFGKKFKI